MRGVTLLELILVVVIIGILTGVGFYAFRPNYLRNDADFVVTQLQNIRYQAIGYDKALGGLGEVNESIGCFGLEDLNDTKGTNYTFRSTLSWDYGAQRLCFDRLGRVYKQDTKAFQREIIKITVEYNGNEMNISVFPQSGEIER